MRALFILLSGLSLVVAGCERTKGGSDRPDLSNRPAKVLATTGMIADAARIVGGDHVQVDCLMGPEIDPHQFVASPRDLGRIANADLVLYNGLHLEGNMTNVLEKRTGTPRTVAVAEGLPDLRAAEEGFEGTHDPHVW